MTITGLRIPADLNEPIRKVPIDSYEDINRNVGGYIELVSIWSGRVTMYVNEEGLLKGLPRNARASRLRDQGQPKTPWNGHPGDYWKYQHGLDLALVGDALLLGPPDGEGNDTGITDKHIKNAMMMIGYKPEAIQAVLDEASLEELRQVSDS